MIIFDVENNILRYVAYHLDPDYLHGDCTPRHALEFTMPVTVRRLPIKLEPDPTRVITRFFCPGDLKRAREIVERVLTFTDEEIGNNLATLKQSFSASHPDLSEIFEEHFQQIQAAIPVDSKLTQAQQSFIGACFTMEYAIESVALLNPSIVPSLIQEGVTPRVHSIPHEPASHRRRPSLVDRFPHGRDRRRG